MGSNPQHVKLTLSDGQEISLTYKQFAWCKFYIMYWNQTKAAELAGYAVPEQSGSRNVKNDRIKAYIDDFLLSNTSTLDEITQRLSEQARMDIGDILEMIPDGGWKIDMEKAKETGFTRHIKKLRWKQKMDKDGNTWTDAEVELKDSQWADDKLLRTLGAYKDKLDVNWQDTLPKEYQDNDVVRQFANAMRKAKKEDVESE